MNQPAWERLVDMIDIKYGIASHGRDQRPLEDKPQLTEEVDFICFERNGQQFRLERVARPSIIEQKSIYHRAAGSQTRHENIYDPDQITHRLNVLTKKGDDWERIDLEDLAL